MVAYRQAVLKQEDSIHNMRVMRLWKLPIFPWGSSENKIERSAQ